MVFPFLEKSSGSSYSETRVMAPRNHRVQVDATTRTGVPGDRSSSLGWSSGVVSRRTCFCLSINRADSPLVPHLPDVFRPHVIRRKESQKWRTLRRSAKGAGYLFNHKALAKVFRAKFIAALLEAGLPLPSAVPQKWVVDCKAVGNGEKALVYLGRYLYRGVIQERDILRCENGCVTYRWRDSKTKKTVQRTVSGATFLWLVLQHVLPTGFRRSRNYGFLHPNSKRLIALLRLFVFKTPATSGQPCSPTTPRPQLQCRCCGAAMVIVRRRILPSLVEPPCPHREQNLSR